MTAPPAQAAPRFQPGDRVQVATATPPGHHRTPAYVKGKTGRVVSAHGPFGNPESLAYGGNGEPKQWLYIVEFRQADLWDGTGENGTLQLELYEHWLAPG